MFNRASLILNTLKYLKFWQFFFQLKKRLKVPTILFINSNKFIFNSEIKFFNDRYFFKKYLFHNKFKFLQIEKYFNQNSVEFFRLWFIMVL